MTGCTLNNKLHTYTVAGDFKYSAAYVNQDGVQNQYGYAAVHILFFVQGNFDVKLFEIDHSSTFSEYDLVEAVQLSAIFQGSGSYENNEESLEVCLFTDSVINVARSSSPNTFQLTQTFQNNVLHQVCFFKFKSAQ